MDRFGGRTPGGWSGGAAAPRRTFDDIQRDRRRSSLALFALLVVFYLLACALLWLPVKALFFLWLGGITRGWHFWSPGETLAVGGAAVGAALLHWFGTVAGGAERILAVLDAAPPDPRDRYHRMLADVAEEMKLAAGLERVEVRVVPTPALNAFAVTDLSGRSVIGVTEGLVSRLTRGQLQGVVAHEMAHLREGDGFLVTMACSLFAVFAQILTGVRSATEEEPQAGILLPLVWLITLGAYFLNVMISRQREYLADAAAVELTRDPVALAEALTRMGRSPAGGFVREELAPLFILSPGGSRLDEAEGVMADLFSTHPPLRARVRALLSMAHLGWSVLERRLADAGKPATPAAQPPAEPLWIAYHGGEWRGPFTADVLARQPWFSPLVWVARAGSANILPARETAPFRETFVAAAGAPAAGCCPLCRIPLREREYEGVMARECPSCRGFLLEKRQEFRILLREEETFPEAVQGKAAAFAALHPLRPRRPASGVTPATAYRCPSCGRPMRRQIYNYQYFIEVDRCAQCGLAWFDRDELEMLQVLVERSRGQGADAS